MTTITNLGNFTNPKSTANVDPHAGIDFSDKGESTGVEGVTKHGSLYRVDHRPELEAREQQRIREAVAVADGHQMQNQWAQGVETSTTRVGPTDITGADQEVVQVMRNGAKRIPAHEAMPTDVVSIQGMTMTVREATNLGLLVRTANGGLASPKL